MGGTASETLATEAATNAVPNSSKAIKVKINKPAGLGAQKINTNRFQGKSNYMDIGVVQSKINVNKMVNADTNNLNTSPNEEVPRKSSMPPLQKYSDPFFALNETVKARQDEITQQRLKNRKELSSNACNKLGSYNSVSEKERLVKKFNKETNNLLMHKPDYLKIKAEKTTESIEMRKNKVIEKNLGNDVKNDKSKYYSMNEKVIKTMDEERKTKLKPRITYIGNINKLQDPLNGFS
eukprot:CAMPEP_0170521734 /NCGR_PEP_ID=MMETSP0209-20121228/7106_1 /TAXON_ID=665100 ORGANISM="Litonotus pictus, Strain P1" /NCGR_SAMPLE_ID=MMETSP0209 /ASSEMBLY_ACC=CAM_ASM_000301 /LENGTH=236 /DNA_ID=CAMNT_0010808781 /DNA_START=600 /DNA_END=1310 /DNA_ORIENTATION=-